MPSASRRTLLLSALVLCAGTVTISACSDDSNPPANGTLALALTPTTINVAQGGSGNSAASITRGGSFTGPVTLSQSGAPAGVTVTFSPGLIPAGSTSAGIAVAVGATVAPGNKVITISAAGDNVTTATATLTLVVVAGGAGSIVLAPNPATLTAAVGAAAVTSAIGITRTAPFTGAVGLSVTGAPAGVTASITPASATGNTATLSVSSAAGAVNGTYPLVVRGTGTGVSDATATVPVTVTGGAAAGASFTFSPNPLPLTAGGASGNSTVTIARSGGFTGALNLALTGAPSGLTASVTPNTNVAGNTATVTAQATGAVAAGTYNLTLTGTGTGIPNAVGTLPVTVTGGGGGGSASFTFCTEDAPIWVASQDNTGAWTRVNATSGSTYQFSFPSGRGGIAYVDTVGAGTDLTVILGTAAEFNAAGGTVNNLGCASDKTLTGSVSGVSNTEAAAVNLGGSSAFVFPIATTNYTLNDVTAGPQDLVATRFDAASFSVNWIIIRRALNLASGSTIPVLPFGTEGFAPASANVTVANLGADTGSVVSLFSGIRGSTFAFLSTIEEVVAASGPQPYAAVPAGNLQANELQQLLAFSSEEDNPLSDRTAGLYFSSVSNRTVTLGPKLSTPTVSKVVTGPNARPNVLLASQAQYNRLFSADYSQANNRSASIIATSAYFGGLPGTWNVTLPDLSAATGWNTNWGLANGTPIDWTVSAQGGAISELDPTIADGSATQSASIESSAPLALRALRQDDDPFATRRRLFNVLRQRGNPLN
jgi:hypothetical protein